MATRYKVIGTALLAVIVVIAVLILRRGNSLVLSSTALPPIVFNVRPVAPATTTPAVTPGSGAPTVSPSLCPLTGYVAVDQSPISGFLGLNNETKTTVKSVIVQVLSKRPLAANAYHACATAMPGYAGNPKSLPVVYLPAAGDVMVPGLDHGGPVALIVRPPASRASGAIAFIWRITVNYNSDEGAGSDWQGPFTLLAPPS